MDYWDIYNARLTINGSTKRERNVNRLKQNVITKAPSNPSYKEIKLNGEDSYLVINTSTKPYYKEFESLPGQKILAGDYVEWSNNIWLVYEVDCDDEIYTDGNLRQCQYELFWQKTDGTIVSRYAWVQNASAYNNGETGNNTITLQSNQFMAYMPYDEDTCLLDNGLRIHMSRDNKVCKPYTLTRPDDITFGYGDKGVLNIVFTQTQYNANEDKLVKLDDGRSVWICNHSSPTTPPDPDPIDPNIPNETANLSAVISGNTSLKIGFERTYTVTFTDTNGNEVNYVDFEWNVSGEFTNKIIKTVSYNTIKLKVYDDSLVGESFLLSVTVSGTQIKAIKLTVAEGF
jgi:hypothetical protein